MDQITKLGPLETATLVALALFVLGTFLGLLRRLGGAPTLVLKEYRVSRAPVEGNFVYLAGRPQGFLSFLLTLIGLGTEIRFTVSRKAVAREEERWSLFPYYAVDSVPIFNVASTHFGCSKNVFTFVVGFVCLLAAVAVAVPAFQGQPDAPLQALDLPRAGRDAVLAVAAGLAVLGLLFCLASFLSKRLEIAVETGGGRAIGVRFKPSVLGRLRVDEDALVEVVEIINSLIARGPAQPSALA
jgi:hypothetical protein